MSQDCFLCEKGEMHMKKKIMGLLLVGISVIALLGGCTSKETTTNDDSKNKEHEAITMQSPFRNVSAFIDKVHEKYPEINLEVIPYSGANYTAYVKAQLKTGDMTDIYCTTYYWPGRDDVKDKLIDLSGYAFTDNYTEARLRDVTDDGAIYLLPTYYDCFGITYNKTLLEKNGWKLPTSFKELEELAVKVKKAGYNLALDETQLPGYGFQYLCNILDTEYLNTPAGRKWQTDFLDSKVTLSDSKEFVKSLDVLEKWKKVGMLNSKGNPNSDNETRLEMTKEKTLFLLGSSNTYTEEETTDEFGIMPYLSEDGTKNAFILNVSRYMGLNKNLEKKGNEQKLEDALHVMEVLSTVDGMQALNSAYANTSLLPLKDYKVKAEGYYADIEDQLNSGATAPFIYAGWESLIVPIGTTVISYIHDEATLDDVKKSIDESQKLLKDNSSSIYTTVTEKLNTDDCAKLIGICFAKAADADVALISKNKWYKLPDDQDLNLEGVSGGLYPLPVTDEEIVSILPTGWARNIMTVTLTGKRIKELAKTGYDRNGDGNTFPYELVMPDGFNLEDDKTYTVAIAGETEEVDKEGKVTDTKILGLTAAQKYFSQFETLSKKDIVWE